MSFAWWHVVIVMLPMLPTFWSIRDIWRHEFTDFQSRVFWLVTVVFIPVFGGLAYIIWGRKKRLGLLRESAR